MFHTLIMHVETLRLQFSYDCRQICIAFFSYFHHNLSAQKLIFYISKRGLIFTQFLSSSLVAEKACETLRADLLQFWVCFQNYEYYDLFLTPYLLDSLIPFGQVSTHQFFTNQSPSSENVKWHLGKPKTDVLGILGKMPGGLKSNIHTYIRNLLF